MINQNLLLTGDDGYNLTNSLRFRSSASAYLNRTFGTPTNNKVWTWSAWIKRGSLTLADADHLFFASPTDVGANPSTYSRLVFETDGTLRLQSNASAGELFTSSALFRDPAAWYHIVLYMDAVNTTVRCYVNGTEITYASRTNPTNTNTAINGSGNHHRMGFFRTAEPRPMDGYMAEVNFIDGQALTPSSFGSTSSTTGVWQPIKYTGTYGTNGFYLPFTDNSALTTSSNVGLGKDFSGNANYWVTNNISITSGSTYDSMTDVPTLTSATAANYCTLNPVSPLASGSITNGNLTFTSGAADAICVGTIGVSSGKYYWEVTATTVNASLSAIGIIGQPPASLTVDLRTPSNGYCYISNGNKGNNNTTSAYGATYTSGDVIGIALDMDAGTLVFYKNNSSQGTAYSSLTGTFTPALSDLSGASSGAVFDCNFGQRPFAYTPPTGFVRLNTFNLPTPTIGATASTQANDYFNIALYTGTGSSQSITGLGFQPDWTWIKGRSGATDHGIYDAVRGVQKQLESNNTDAETTETTGLTAFGSDGFTVGALAQLNTSSATYVGWNWKASGTTSNITVGQYSTSPNVPSIASTVSANTTAGFSIVTYSGNNTDGATIGHGLGVNPSMIIVKRRTSTSQWIVMHTKLTANKNIFLSATNAEDAITGISGGGISTATTSTTFTAKIGSSNIDNVNGTSNTYVAYCFAQIAGYSAFGSYTGNGSTDGPFVYLGFRPRFVMIKSTGSQDWVMLDSSTNPYNVAGNYLRPNSSGAENSGSSPTTSTNEDFLSNGIKFRNDASSSGYTNGSGVTYIYAAFAENPFKYANAR